MGSRQREAIQGTKGAGVGVGAERSYLQRRRASMCALGDKDRVKTPVIAASLHRVFLGLFFRFPAQGSAHH